MTLPRYVLAFALCAAAGCAPAPAPAPAAIDGPAEAPSEDGSETMTMESMDLVMYDDSVSTDKRPTIRVHADRGSLMAQDPSAEKPAWSLEGARAVVYRDNSEELTLEAASGMFDEAKGIAALDGGVSMRSNEFDMDLERVEWDNEKRLAHSESPVTLRRGETSIAADGFTLNPDDRTIALTNVSGWLDLTPPEES